MIRVLHAIDVYLRVSENWIYPQIHCDSEVSSAVLCRNVENLDQFPLRKVPMFLDPPRWSESLGIPRLINSLAFRAGHSSLVAAVAVRRWKPDLIHAHFGMHGWSLLPLKQRLRIPMITSFYGIDAWALPERNALWHDRYRELFESGESFIVEGPAMGDRLKAIGCAASKIHTVHIGIDLSALPLSPRKLNAVPRVLMLGRFTEKKGLIDGLRACVEARRRGGDFLVTIVGDAVSGDKTSASIKAELHKIAASPELNNRVCFAGSVSVAKSRVLMREHDIFLCPSKHARDGDAAGGSPVSLTEAMALGLHCIGTRHCDIPEVIRHGETGLLATSGDIQALAALLAEAIENLEETRMREHGRKHIEERFSASAQREAFQKIYSVLIARVANRTRASSFVR